MRRGIFKFEILLLGALFLGCGEEVQNTRGGVERMAGLAVDTTDIGTRYAEIDSLHALMMTQYEGLRGEMPESMRQLYGSMNDMHGTASEMHRAMMQSGMMGPDGRMGEDHMMDDEGMMGRGMHGDVPREGMMNLHRTREWDQQMAAMHAQMGAYMRRQGYEEMAALHEEMGERFRSTRDALPEDLDTADEGGDDEAEADAEPVSGRSIYSRECAACHGTGGEGMSGLFPPLSGSDWVTGEASVPVRILLNGLEGPVQVRGEEYDGTMPAFRARLSNREIAAVVSYIRDSWQNDADEVRPALVREIRRETGSRSEPWTVDELN